MSTMVAPTPLAPTLVENAVLAYTRTQQVRVLDAAYDLNLRTAMFEQRLRARLMLDPITTVVTARLVTGRLEASVDRNLRPDFIVLTVSTKATPDPLTPLVDPGVVDPIDLVEVVHAIGRTPAENMVRFAIYKDNGGVPFTSPAFSTLLALGEILATGWLSLIPAAPPTVGAPV